jgi:hypothetical protein
MSIVTIPDVRLLVPVKIHLHPEDHTHIMVQLHVAPFRTTEEAFAWHQSFYLLVGLRSFPSLPNIGFDVMSHATHQTVSPKDTTIVPDIDPQIVSPRELADKLDHYIQEHVDAAFKRRSTEKASRV